MAHADQLILVARILPNVNTSHDHYLNRILLALSQAEYAIYSAALISSKNFPMQAE